MTAFREKERESRCSNCYEFSALPKISSPDSSIPCMIITSTILRCIISHDEVYFRYRVRIFLYNTNLLFIAQLFLTENAKIGARKKIIIESSDRNDDNFRFAGYVRTMTSWIRVFSRIYVFVLVRRSYLQFFHFLIFPLLSGGFRSIFVEVKNG